MDLLETLNRHWGWAGLKAQTIIAQNDFGNLLVLDAHGTYWRVCPEELSCEPVAQTEDAFDRLIESEAFQRDWNMAVLVDSAHRKLGALKPGWVYYLVIPAILGGQYAADNIQTAPLDQVIALSGDWALEVKDLPDGAQIKLRVID